MGGQILGDRYEVERQIGKQTGRWTLLARDLTTQSQVVIKLLFLAEQLGRDDLKLFEREVEILQSLSHPSIPRYLGYFEHELPNDRALALIQTYVEGRSLEDLMQQGRQFTEAEVRQIAKAVLYILVYLQQRQPPIVHRDIKPSNILLANRQVHLVDFGSVKALTGRETSQFTIVGTYGYMPPEQFSGRAVPASDLYSLAVTLVAILTGVQPSNLPRRHSKIDIQQVPNLSPEFADWLDWLLQPDLSQRAKYAQDALHALDYGRPVTSSPVEKPSESKVFITKDANRFELVIPAILGQTQLQIDPQQIVLFSKRLGLQSSRPIVAARQAIQRIEYRRDAASKGNEVQSDQAPPAAKLVIWAGSQRFELGEHPLLTRRELDWLAYELSTWLRLPVV